MSSLKYLQTHTQHQKMVQIRVIHAECNLNKNKMCSVPESLFFIGSDEESHLDYQEKEYQCGNIVSVPPPVKTGYMEVAHILCKL